MDESKYYKSIFDKICNSLRGNHWVLGSGEELIKHGWDPDKLLVTAEQIDQLWKLSVEWNLEIFKPVFGYSGESVLFAKDAEIFLADPRYLYHNMGSQLHFFEKYIAPIVMFETNFLQKHGVPHIIDLTPSGWHVLFTVKRGTKAYDHIKNIGCLEDELATAYSYTDPNDIKRNPAVGPEAGLVYSGMGRLKEYLALRAMAHAQQHPEVPTTISDSEEKCVNEDITDTGDPGFMRIMRIPFSLHKKRRRYFPGSEPLQDVIFRFFPGKNTTNDGKDVLVNDWEYLLSCMWSKEMAVKHSRCFTGKIPVATDESIDGLVSEYKRSGLYRFHQEFDSEPELEPGKALHGARYDADLSDKSKDFIMFPCPRALQPKVLKKFIRNLIENNWHPKHIGCLINDLYRLPIDWNVNWMKYISRTRANFWARIYGAVYLLEQKQMAL